MEGLPNPPEIQKQVDHAAKVCSRNRACSTGLNFARLTPDGTTKKWLYVIALDVKERISSSRMQQSKSTDKNTGNPALFLSA